VNVFRLELGLVTRMQAYVWLKEEKTI